MEEKLIFHECYDFLNLNKMKMFIQTYKTMNEETDNYTINLKIQEAHGWQSQFEKLKKRTSDGFEQKKGAENAITSEKGTLNNYKKD